VQRTNRGRRGQRGFSLALSIFVGIILTGVTFAILKRSSNEVQVASSNSDSVNALNAAESAGAVAMDDLIKRGNAVTIPAGTTANLVLRYLCRDNPSWVLVQRPTANANYRLISTASSTIAPATFLKQDGTAAAADGSNAFDPLTLTSTENLPAANLAEIKAQNSDTTSHSVGANTTFALNLGMDTLTTNSCNGLTDPNTPVGVVPNNTITKTYLPGAIGLSGLTWAGLSTANADIPINARQIGSLGDKQVWGVATLQNFRLSQVQVISGTVTGNPTRNKPLSLFRLVYSFNVRGEGQIRSSSGNVIARQVIQAPNILIIDLAETANLSFAQYGYFVSNFNGLFFGGNEVYDGNVYLGTAPGFFVNNGELLPQISGTFTTAGCRTRGSTATPCKSVNIPAGQYGTYYTGGTKLGSTATLAQSANFQSGGKFSEDGAGYLPKPTDGGYQLKSTLFGNALAAPDPNDDVLKNSEIRAALGVQVSSETAPPNGVYWTNPTDHASSSSQASDYNSWLTKATSTTTANPNNNDTNLLKGIYIKGDVDNINMYAAKSSSTAASADVQVVEIQQTTVTGKTSTIRRTKFIMNKVAKMMSVQVASGSTGTEAYGTATNYNNTPDGTPNGMIFVDGKVGTDVGSNAANTQGCTVKRNCRGVISIPENNTAATLSFTSGADTPAIQKDWGLTIAANGNIAIQDNLDYQVDPRGADHHFDDTNTAHPDDPTLANAQNALGIVAFDQKKVKDASNSIITTDINSQVYWGNGLKDNARKDTVNGQTVDVVDVQAAIYGNKIGIDTASIRVSEYIRLLGGEIQTTAAADFSSGCSSTANLPGGGTLASTVCKGGRMNLTGDRRMQNGTLAPPGFPTLQNGGILTYIVNPVGQQSVGKTRWQTLMYQPS
jgi:Tfp pilus assembly protein PilX